MRKHKKIGRSLLRSGQLTILLLLISCFVSAQTNTSSNSPCDFSTYHPAFFPISRTMPFTGNLRNILKRPGEKASKPHHCGRRPDREGNVVKACCEEGDELLRAAALKAASK